ncbi:MAG TPA: hypothetical protein VFV07_00705 [Rhizomicrobium sp.]|nr:hypothetical protein [Rhizomicrobium sp.]
MSRSVARAPCVAFGLALRFAGGVPLREPLERDLELIQCALRDTGGRPSRLAARLLGVDHRHRASLTEAIRAPFLSDCFAPGAPLAARGSR